MEKGKAKQLLDKMQVLIEDGQNVPFAAGKDLVKKEEKLELQQYLPPQVEFQIYLDMPQRDLIVCKGYAL